MLCNKIQGCRGQNHAGEVSKFKFRYLSLICAVLHLSSISGSSSTQKNSKFIEGRSKKSGATKYRVVEVRIMQERFLNWSLGLCLWFELFYTFLAYLEGPQNKKTRNLLKAEAKKSGATKCRVVEVRIMQERFLNSSLGVCLWFLLFYTFLKYLEGPQNKKTRNLLKKEAKKAVQQNTVL